MSPNSPERNKQRQEAFQGGADVLDGSDLALSNI